MINDTRKRCILPEILRSVLPRVTYQLSGHGVAGPERQVVGYWSGLTSVLLQARAVLRQPSWIHQTMEIRLALCRDVDDYRLTRTLDLHGARYRNGC